MVLSTAENKDGGVCEARSDPERRIRRIKKPLFFQDPFRLRGLEMLL